MKQRAYELMKTWCDTLLTYKVSSPHTLLDGSLLCPVCHVVHGRIADMAFPLALLYVKTGEERYLKEADSLLDWTDRNLSRPDGSLRNDAGNEWKGPCIFTAIAVGEVLYRFGDALPRETHDKWMKLFVRISDYVNTVFVKTVKTVINYSTGVACEQALAWRLTGEERYREAADRAEAVCRAHFDENGLLYGEKCPIDAVTPKGVRPIDMGYNIEESLPNLVRYSQLVGNRETFYRERYRDHLEFLLSDGAIDNSWGSRHNKWTWWGSRTSDGALSGLALLADEPLFADACERVLSLYEKCTHNGLLSLPMADEAGEPTCLHHSFCHAKALAVLADAENIVETPRVPLPCETDCGIKFFQNGNVALVSHKSWRATISASDIVYADGCENGGGSMTLLVKNGKPICAATMRNYRALEPLNMQFLRTRDQTPCMTPRLMFTDGSDSLQDMSVTLSQINADTLHAAGNGWEIRYRFDDALSITVKTDRAGFFVLPIVRSGAVRCGETDVSVGDVTVTAKGIRRNEEASGFNQVGGFIWETLEIPLDASGETILTVKADE